MDLRLDFLRRVDTREAVCGVVGLGYVGLPLAVEFAAAGPRHRRPLHTAGSALSCVEDENPGLPHPATT